MPGVFVPGDGKVVVVHPLSLVPWTVIFEQPASALYKDVYPLKRNLLLVGLLLMVVALAVWMPIVDTFVGPIRELTREAQRIASGDLSHPIPRDGRDEITALSISLDRMRRQLDDDRKELQAQVAKLGELNRLKSEFIANLSHEFRTPVHIARGYIDLIRDGAFGQAPDHLGEPLGVVAHQYERLWETLESCLDLGRIDAGEIKVHAERFDLCNLAREVVDEFTPRLQKKGLRGSVSFPRTAYQVTSDKAKVQATSSHR